jgi:CheY-like chemotaxis protein
LAQSDLFAILASTRIRPEFPVSSISMPLPNSPSPLRVLIVDSGLVCRQLAEFLLRYRGHVPQSVPTAADACALLNSSAPFDLLLLDASLPQTELVEMRRLANAHGFRVPAWGMSNDPSAAPAGFDAVLVRPLNPSQLDELLARWFRPAVDEAALMNQLGGNRQVLSQLVQILKKNSRSWESNLRAAVAAADAESIRRTAHQAKGALGNFAADKAARLAGTLEELGKTANLATAPSIIDELTGEIRRVEAALDKLLNS